MYIGKVHGNIKILILDTLPLSSPKYCNDLMNPEREIKRYPVLFWWHYTFLLYDILSWLLKIILGSLFLLIFDPKEHKKEQSLLGSNLPLFYVNCLF